MTGVSAYDPLDNLAQVEDPRVQYLYSKKKVLESLGIEYIGQLYFVNPEEVSGVDALKYDQGLVRLRNFLIDSPGLGVDAYTLLQRRMNLERFIHTGSVSLDYILGGGIKTGIITELAGPYRSGKTQISLTSSVAVQLPPAPIDCDIVIDSDKCKLASKQYGVEFDDLGSLDRVGRGLGKKAIYIDTEKTFEAERIIPIAKRFGLDPEEALKNIIVYQVTSVSEQFEAAMQAGIRVPVDNVGLVVVDSLMHLFRSEYVGRERLAERQQMVNKFVHLLLRMASIYNIAVIITNQVMDVPDMRYGGGGDAYSLKVVGGHVVAHNVGIRMMLNTASASSVKDIRRTDNPSLRRAKIVDSSFLPQREIRFGIADQGVVDVELDTLCNFVISDLTSIGHIRGNLDRLIIPPSQQKLNRKMSAAKGSKTRKGIKSYEDAVAEAQSAKKKSSKSKKESKS